MTARRLVLATRNEHKVHELRQILADLVDELDLQIVSAAEVDGPDVPETEVTFEGNARLKAVALAAATGMPAVADDSGLAVDVLGGSPGVFSARWSGTTGGADLARADRDRANVRLLLEQVADVRAGAPVGGVRLRGGPRAAGRDRGLHGGSGPRVVDARTAWQQRFRVRPDLRGAFSRTVTCGPSRSTPTRRRTRSRIAGARSASSPRSSGSG